MSDDGHFDARIAKFYDDDPALYDPKVIDPIIDVLARLAGQGRALEFGLGTGRIALPLARRGVPVHGIDLSIAMIDCFSKKPGASGIGVTIGDFATTVVEGAFSLVYLVFNTMMNLTTQADQVLCFRNAAKHLEPGGFFLVEVMVPGLQRISPGESLLAFDLSETHWGIDEYDVVTQDLVSHHLRVVNGTLERYSTPLRYVWPSELDLMGEFAGLRLRERWGGWNQEPFTRHSTAHVSVWERTAARLPST